MDSFALTLLGCLQPYISLLSEATSIPERQIVGRPTKGPNRALSLDQKNDFTSTASLTTSASFAPSFETFKNRRCQTHHPLSQACLQSN